MAELLASVLATGISAEATACCVCGCFSTFGCVVVVVSAGVALVTVAAAVAGVAVVAELEAVLGAVGAV